MSGAHPGATRVAASQIKLESTVGWALLPFGLLAFWELSGWDLPFMRLLADSHGFIWREHWLTRSLLHDGGRVLSAGVLIALLGAAWRPGVMGPSRPERLWSLAAIVLCLLAVPAVKRWSSTSCPWSLQEFGGAAVYVSHWVRGEADGGPGGCFPSGHAVAAFAFLPQGVMWWRHDRRRAAAWLLGVAVFGVLFGLAQSMRGAHFPSHTLWSACLCWALALALALASVRLMPRRVASLSRGRQGQTLKRLTTASSAPSAPSASSALSRPPQTAVGSRCSTERATDSATSMPSTPADMMPPA